MILLYRLMIFMCIICVVLLKSFPDLQTSQHTRALVTSDRSCNVWAWKSMVFVKASLWASWDATEKTNNPTAKTKRCIYLFEAYRYVRYIYGCGSKCKVWIKPRSHTRSRPPIQTFRKDLIQTFDPDLWNDIIYWWVYVWSSDGCMFLGFLLCRWSPCQATKQQTVVKPRCQAVKLPSCTATLLSSPAAKLQLLCIQAVKLPSCHCCKL